MGLSHRLRHAPLVLLLALFAIAACEQEDRPPTVQMDIPFRLDAILDFVRADGTALTTIAVEIADNDSARARGLMQRRKLPARGGMLFLFPEAGDRSFWMKNTPLPLDILFIGPDSQIVNIAEHTHPFSEEQVRSAGPAQYVLEVRAGCADRYGITEGMRVRWRAAP